MKPLVKLVLVVALLQLVPACGDSSPDGAPDRELDGAAGAAGAPDDAPTARVVSASDLETPILLESDAIRERLVEKTESLDRRRFR